MNRRSFLSHLSASGLLPIWGLVNRLGASAREQDLLAGANARIEEHRKADGIVVVRDVAGQLLRGLAVSVTQIRHDFLFGANLFRFGRIRTPSLEAAYRKRFADLFNYATVGFYWASFEPVRGRPQYGYMDEVAAWCKEHGIRCKGHPLVWDDPSSVPSWLPEDSSRVEELSTARVRDCVSHFAGRIDTWDVVNEPTLLTRYKNPMSSWANRVGAVEFVRRNLVAARSSNPQGRFLVNDSRTDSRYETILRGLRESGKPLYDAIGIESHMHGGEWSLERAWEVCQSYAAFGVPIHFTEVTVLSGGRASGGGAGWTPTSPQGEARQADYVGRLYTLLFSHPSVEAVTWWDVSDDGAWQSAPAGLIRGDMSPKPAYDRLEDLVRRQWWTRVSGRTNARGELSVRAFHGLHRIEVTSQSGSKMIVEGTWSRGVPNRFEVVVGA